jgi:hypothetical protein
VPGRNGPVTERPDTGPARAKWSRIGGGVPATGRAVEQVQGGRAGRSRSWPVALAWGLYGLVLALFATFPVLDRLLRDAGRPDLALLAPFVIPPSLAALTASTVGVVLASRRPRHPVGWLLLGLGLAMAAGGTIAGYLPYTVVVRPGSLPAANLLARVYAPMTDLALAALGFVLLLTPTGSAPSPRWRRWGFAAAGAMATLAVAATVAPGPLDARVLSFDGPVGPRAFGGALQVANQLALLVAFLVILGGAGSLVTRFRHARGVERLQLRWVALAAALTGVATAATAALGVADDMDLAGWTSVIGTVFLPLATGAAILRYRLYDLDRIISRTVAYALLTVLLGLGYAAVVLGLGRLLPDSSSSLAVAAATLVVAAAFQPARRRVQALVDRRFNRRRHDAAQTLQAFSDRLRQQVDLDALHGELLAVVDQTMQPTRASLWLRPRPGAAPAVRPTGR